MSKKRISITLRRTLESGKKIDVGLLFEKDSPTCRLQRESMKAYQVMGNCSSGVVDRGFVNCRFNVISALQSYGLVSIS